MITKGKPSASKINIVVIIFVSLCLVGLLSVSAFAIAIARKPAAKQTKTTEVPSLGFYMSTSNSRPKVGDQFDVKLYANTNNKQVKTISALLNYDASRVQAIATSSAPKADPLAGIPVKGFDLTLACGPANGCRTDNQIAFALTNTGQNMNSGNGLYIGTVRLKALKSGATSISYAPEAQQTGFLNPDANVQGVLNTRQIKNLTLEIKK